MATRQQPTRPPANGHRLPWYERRDWKRTGVQLLRFYSKRSDYSFRLKPGQTQPLACVIPSRKRVEVTTEFPDAKSHCNFALDQDGSVKQGVPTGLVRHYDLLRHRPTEMWLKGFTGHEAGHILYSNEKPQAQTLGWLWNALEDERMERLTAGVYDELLPIFDCMGDVMLTETREEQKQRESAQVKAAKRARDGKQPEPRTILQTCLQWRWLWDHARAGGTPEYHPYLIVPKSVFSELRPLIEAAWTADSSDEVTEVARKILAKYDIPEGRELPEGLEVGDVPGGQAPAGGTPQDPGGDAGENAEAGEADAGDAEDGNAEDGDAEDGSASDDEDSGDAEERDPGRSGDAQAEEPDMPAIDPHGAAARAGSDLLDGHVGAARSLSQALRPKQQSRLRSPHRSRGRFEYRRHVQGRDRQFSRKPRRAEPPAFLTVLLDLSDSMNWGDDDLIGNALQATALLSAATEMAGTYMRVIPFKKVPGRPLSTLDVSHEMLRVALSTAEAGSGTKLAPALRAASKGVPQGAGKHVIVLITDGALERADAARTKKAFREISAGSNPPLVLPLLIGGAADQVDPDNDPTEDYKAIFRRHAAVSDVGELGEVVTRWLKHAAG